MSHGNICQWSYMASNALLFIVLSPSLLLFSTVVQHLAAGFHYGTVREGQEGHDSAVDSNSETM